MKTRNEMAASGYNNFMTRMLHFLLKKYAKYECSNTPLFRTILANNSLFSVTIRRWITQLCVKMYFLGILIGE